MENSKEVLDEATAAKCFAVAWNRLDSSVIEPLLSDDVIYESQHVLVPIVGRKKFIDYLQGKMDTVKKGGDDSKVFADIGLVMNNKPCVIMAQRTKSNLLATVLFDIDNNLIKRIDMCGVAPRPSEAKRYEEYPEEL